MEATHLIKEIIDKGGIIGLSGKKFSLNEDLATRYIIECSKQLNTKLAQALWGRELISKIELFSLKNLLKEE